MEPTPARYIVRLWAIRLERNCRARGIIARDFFFADAAPARVFDAFQRPRREAVKSLRCRPGGGAADKELRKTGAITAIKLKSLSLSDRYFQK
jgi:hypothetical protein